MRVFHRIFLDGFLQAVIPPSQIAQWILGFTGHIDILFPYYTMEEDWETVSYGYTNLNSFTGTIGAWTVQHVPTVTTDPFLDIGDGTGLDIGDGTTLDAGD